MYPTGPGIVVPGVEINYDYGPYHIVASVPDANGTHPTFEPPVPAPAPAMLSGANSAAPVATVAPAPAPRPAAQVQTEQTSAAVGAAPCRLYSRGMCDKGSRCSFRHVRVVAETTSAWPRAYPCRFYPRCGKGTNCTFRHYAVPVDESPA